MLDPTLSRARQKQLLEEMAARKLDAVVVGLPRTRPILVRSAAELADVRRVRLVGRREDVDDDGNKPLDGGGGR